MLADVLRYNKAGIIKSVLVMIKTRQAICGFPIIAAHSYKNEAPCFSLVVSFGTTHSFGEG